ncbi:hypothetical protein HT031_003223 [Scenedesmus sp. PABB004]|nr:hypothetical protein HT031_003223 [Scenedesmus sp. PABB004]
MAAAARRAGPAAPLRAAGAGACAPVARATGRGPPRRAAALAARSSSGGSHSFVLYTKPDCPLCDGLKDKVRGLIDRAEFVPCFLSGATLEVRDIATNAAWQDAMHLAVPVLAVVDEQGNEVVLPRPQPRVTADRLQRHLEEALRGTAAASSCAINTTPAPSGGAWQQQ